MVICCVIVQVFRSIRNQFLVSELFYRLTRSTRTVHTSTTVRITSVAVRIRIRISIRIRDPDRHQNLGLIIFCSLAHCQPSLKISCKSVRKFLRKVANRQTNRQTEKKRRRLHIFLGEGNNVMCSKLWVIYVKKLISLKHCVRSQITRLKLQKSFCDLEHGASL